MKSIFITCLICVLAAFFNTNMYAQNQLPASSIVEGGKTLVELIKVIKPAQNQMKDCLAKQVADICFKNKTGEKIQISLYKRNDTGYVETAFKIIALSKSEECLYELNCGVYKYQIEVYLTDKKSFDILKSGEIKLQPCDKSIREISNK